MSQLKGGLILLKEIVHRLPPSERKIAEYIIENPDTAILLTASQLGQESDTSSTAVMRLCKSLGLSGLQELKIRVAGDIQNDTLSSEFRDIVPNESLASIIDKVTSNTVHSLRETVDILSYDNIQKAVETLKTAKSIIFIGFGASNIAAVDAEQKFIRINKNATFYPDVHMAATAIATRGEGDVLVGISFSGQTIEVIKLMELAKRNKMRTISITKYGPSPVMKLADIQLYTSTSKEATFRSGATSSRIAQLHMIDILFMCYASSQYEETINYLDETREAIQFIHKNKK